ncbi:hypothetical protein [Alicyclobacillus sendaiensis]|uniref:hypothetical protein n=1 Tax=Alicyclobacillus sendaiensis TaxID=192387 RepID=UPI0026F47D67|nr:hypothetical protein [Alicyclobacillus sendaiensis]
MAMRHEHGTPVPNRHRERASGGSEISIYRMDPVEGPVSSGEVRRTGVLEADG